jgi:ribonuclease P protein component
MLPRTARLPRAEFSSQAYGTIRTPYFLIKAKENKKETGRIGVVVGKAVHKTAIRRNFLKRQTKATLLKLSRPGKDIVIILSPRANELSKTEFKKELLKASGRIS